jgi:hypothetical protein
LGLGQPLVQPANDGWSKKRKRSLLPQTFLMLSGSRGEVQVHGLFTLSAVASFPRHADHEQYQQLLALKLDPARAVTWHVSHASALKGAQQLDVERHCRNLSHRTVATLSPEGVAWLHGEIEDGQLPCSIGRVRCWRLPATCVKPTFGTRSVVTPETFCAAACLDRPPAEAPVAAEVPLALVPAATPQPAPARAMLPVASSSASSSARAPAHPVADAPRAAMVQWRCNVEPRACGFSSYRYQAPSVFLALQLTSKLKTLGTNGEFHQV